MFISAQKVLPVAIVNASRAIGASDVGFQSML